MLWTNGPFLHHIATTNITVVVNFCQGVKIDAKRRIYLPCKDVSPRVSYRSAGGVEAFYVNSMNRRTCFDFI